MKTEILLIVGVGAGLFLASTAWFAHSHRSYFAEVGGDLRTLRRQPGESDWSVDQTENRLGPYYTMLGGSRRVVSAPEEQRLGVPWSPPVAYGARDHAVAIAQAGLLLYNRYFFTKDERFLERAVQAADILVELQTANGAWPYSFAFHDLQRGWVSAMAQGEACSLLLRVHQSTGAAHYCEAAERSLRCMLTPVSEGGTLARFPDGDPVLEEYPDSQSTPYALNGSIFALWGLRDHALAAGSRESSVLFQELSDALAGHLDDYDTGSWTRYALPSNDPRLAPPRYHNLHITQARVMAELTGDSRWAEAAKRWEQYRATRAQRHDFWLWWEDSKRRARVLQAKYGLR